MNAQDLINEIEFEEKPKEVSAQQIIDISNIDFFYYRRYYPGVLK